MFIIGHYHMMLESRPYHTLPICSILRALAKLQKVSIKFILCICLYLGFWCTEFCWVGLYQNL